MVSLSESAALRQEFSAINLLMEYPMANAHSLFIFVCLFVCSFTSLFYVDGSLNQGPTSTRQVISQAPSSIVSSSF